MATFQTGFQSADGTLLVGTFLGKLKHRAEHHEGIEGVDLEELCKKLKRSAPEMVRLALPSRGIHYGACDALGAAIGRCTSIERLELWGNHLGDEGCRQTGD